MPRFTTGAERICRDRPSRGTGGRKAARYPRQQEGAIVGVQTLGREREHDARIAGHTSPWRFLCPSWRRDRRTPAVEEDQSAIGLPRGHGTAAPARAAL